MNKCKDVCPGGKIDFCAGPETVVVFSAQIQNVLIKIGIIAWKTRGAPLKSKYNEALFRF